MTEDMNTHTSIIMKWVWARNN